MKKKGYHVVLNILLILHLFLMSACDSPEMKGYYLQKDHYIEATGTIIHIKYNENQDELYLGFSDLEPTFDDVDFKIVGDNLSVVQQNGIDEKIELGTSVEFITAPRYFGDGYVMPIVGLTVDGEELLSFDEGYENGYTTQILDVLKEKGVTAVFFVTMDYVRSQPELVQRMIDEGHVIGNHSVNHKSMPTLTTQECIDEIWGLHEYMVENFGYNMTLFRPPEGSYSEATLKIASMLGYKTMLWSFAYADWSVDNQPDISEAYDKVTGKTHGGAIYLLHAVSSTNTAILGDVIDYWQDSGYTVGAYTEW